MHTWIQRHRFVFIPLCLALGAGTLFLPRRSDACAYQDAPPVDTSPLVVDANAESFLGGRLVLLRPGFRARVLVPAYRWLSGVPLDAEEQRSMLTELRGAHGLIPHVEPPRGVDLWRTARANAVGDEGPEVTEGWIAAEPYGGSENCLNEAFATAARTLRQRIDAHATTSDVRAWVAAQDVVFQNCDQARIHGATFTPPPAAAGASTWLVKDREYQIAASHFYATHYAEAERLFMAIASDTSSPWAPMGRYLAARCKTRAGDLAGARALLASVQPVPGGPTAEGIDGYASYVAIRENRIAAHAAIATRIMGGHLGANYAATQFDYLYTLDESSDDDLAQFIHAMQSDQRDAFETAYRRYQQLHTLPWLVASLTHATGQSSGVSALLAAAEREGENSPATLLLTLHRARLLLETGHRSAAWTLANHALSLLQPADGPSASNEAHLLAFRSAPNQEAALAHLFVSTAPPGDWEAYVQDFDEISFTPPRAIPRSDLPEAAAPMFATGLPLSRLVSIANAAQVPAESHAQLVASAYVRAVLLDRAEHRELATTMRAVLPNTATYVDAIERGASADHRRLALAYMLLKVPNFSLNARAHYASGFEEAPINSSYNQYGWCEVDEDAGSAPPYLTPAERASVRAEIATLHGFGSSAAFLARESVRLAAIFPNDPRIPEMLHLSVRLGRFGCGADSYASRDAFRYLHAHYAQSPFAERTPYYY